MENSEIDQTTQSVDLGEYLSLLWHWAWLIVLVGILAAAGAYLYSRQITPIYESTTSLMVNVAPANASVSSSSITVNEELTSTYVAMITKSPVTQEVAKRLGLDNLKKVTITATVVSNTELIDITVQSPDPKLAADVANTIVQVFSDQIQQSQSERFSTSEKSLQDQLATLTSEIDSINKQITSSTDQSEKDRLQTQLTSYNSSYASLLQSYESVRLADTQSTSTISQVEPAVVSASPISPKPFRNAGLAAVVGILLAGGVIFAIEMLDDTLRTPEDITKKLGLPVLGIISHFELENAGKPITEEKPRSPTSEAFRSLRTNVQYAGAGIDKSLKCILVTSPTPGEGKTTITVNLGIVLAQLGKQVAVVDADLRRPGIHHTLGLTNHVGLSQAFMEEGGKLNGSLQISRITNLSVLTTGSLPPNPSELLGSQRMGNILDDLKKRSDIVLIDTPPALAVTDAAILAPLADGVLLVMRPGTTRLASARQVVDQLRRTGANLLGIVLNNVDMHNSRYNYYYNRYHYYNYYHYYGYGDSRSGNHRK